ncbi:unnamed protein product, partial [Hymenolepis diminuta]|uniref:glutathione transferase n=1 Tax=Hymenolepis diminuta TaxID=6216 RepID=A0A0R3SZ12_HYMDI
MAPILAYWDVRGIGESIRLLLRYLGVEFEDKFYHFGPGKLPYYIDGDFKLTQSSAILEYIADKHDM